MSNIKKDKTTLELNCLKNYLHLYSHFEKYAKKYLNIKKKKCYIIIEYI